MSSDSIDLRVELPAFSHSFNVSLSTASSVRDIKEEIKRICPGTPRVDGQRVIWRGRILRDEERVQDIWKTPNESRVVHLSVHPSAWTGAPPVSLQASPASPASIPATTSPAQGAPGRPPLSSPNYYHHPPPVAMPLGFLVHSYNTAIHVLLYGNLPPPSLDAAQLSTLRHYAVSVVQSYGWSWPAVLDEGYPPHDDANPGVRYDRTMIDQQPYLSLSTPNTPLSPRQTHAISVLTYTFPLLSIPSPDSLSYQHIPSYPTQSTASLNAQLQQLGLPPLRVAHNQPAVPAVNQNGNDANNPLAGAEMRAFPIRAFMMPVMMMAFRTILLVYFFSPSKRPVFAIIFSLWIIYELWGALRAVLGHGDPPIGAGEAGGDGGLRGDGNAGGNNLQREGMGAAAGQAIQPGVPPGGPTASPGRRRSTTDIILDKLGNMNLGFEEFAIFNDSPVAQIDPGFWYKVKTFVVLLFTTLHPAVWDRRRAVLRRREGRLRTEGNIRESEPPAPAQEGENNAMNDARARAREQMIAKHERRPRWVREYVDRVLMSDWQDEA